MTQKPNVNKSSSVRPYHKFDAEFFEASKVVNKDTGEEMELTPAFKNLITYIQVKQDFFNNKLFEDWDLITLKTFGKAYSKNGTVKLHVRNLIDFGLIKTATTQKGNIKCKGLKSALTPSQIADKYTLVNFDAEHYVTDEAKQERLNAKEERLNKWQESKQPVPTPSIEPVTNDTPSHTLDDVEALQKESMRLSRLMCPTSKLEYKKDLHRLISNDIDNHNNDGGGVLVAAINNTLEGMAYSYSREFVGAVISVNEELDHLVNKAWFYSKSIEILNTQNDEVNNPPIVGNNNNNTTDEQDLFDEFVGELPF